VGVIGGQVRVRGETSGRVTWWWQTGQTGQTGQTKGQSLTLLHSTKKQVTTHHLGVTS